MEECDHKNMSQALKYIMMEDACAFPNRVKISRTQVLPCAAGDVIWSSANKEESGLTTVKPIFIPTQPLQDMSHMLQNPDFLSVGRFINNGQNDHNTPQVSRSERLTFIDISATKIAVKM